MGMEVLKMLGALVAVIGLMAAVAYVAKKFLYGASAERSQVVAIEVLSQKLLQPKRMLYVVKVLNKVLVLGSTEQGIQPLGEIDDEDVIKAVEEVQEAQRSEKSTSFSDLKHRLYRAETLGDFFHRPFNVILWRGDKPGIGTTVSRGEKARR